MNDHWRLSSQRSASRRPRRRAFLLFEIILALGVFGLVILALARAMQSTMESMSMGRMESYVREELASRITLTQLQPVQAGEYQEPDDPRQVRYHRTIEELPLQTREGIRLTRFYRVIWTASWTDSGGERSKTYQIYLHDDDPRN